MNYTREEFLQKAVRGHGDMRGDADASRAKKRVSHNEDNEDNEDKRAYKVQGRL